MLIRLLLLEILIWFTLSTNAQFTLNLVFRAKIEIIVEKSNMQLSYI